MPDDQVCKPCEPTDIKTSVVKLVLGVVVKPVTAICQNEVCFILLLILGLGGYGCWIAALKFETFAKEQIPLHIEAINKGNKEVSVQFSDDLKSQREHYLELRKIDESNIDRIERLATGKASVGPAEHRP